MTNQYKVTLSEDHIKIIQEALNLYFRIGLNQFEDLRYHLALGNGDLLQSTWCDVYNMISKLILALPAKALHSKEVPDTVRSAMSIHDVLRHKLAWDNAVDSKITDSYEKRVFPEMIYVHYDTPQKYGELPLIEIERVKE